MSQTNVIAGGLLVAFIIFITVRGKLNKYLSLFITKRETIVTGGDNEGGEKKEKNDTFLKKLGIGDDKAETAKNIAIMYFGGGDGGNV